MSRLSNKVAVITGGNSGIGLATAQRFIHEGANVVIFGRDAGTLASALETLGKHAIAVQGDVTKPADLDKLFDRTVKTFGKIDILFANAGVARFAPFAETDESLFDNILDINLKGAYQTVQKALPYLNDNASVLFNTSVVGVKGIAGSSVYSASKAALRSLVRTLATELLERGIRVNAVSPGPIETPIFDKFGWPKETQDEMAKNFAASNPMKRFGKAAEVAGSALFLASDDSSFITGSEIAVDGGLSQL